MKRIKIGARAPLRLGLAGGGSDVEPYCSRYGGYVLNATINRYAYAYVQSLPDGEVVFHAADQGVQWNGTLENLDQVPRNLQLHRGVYLRTLKDFSQKPNLGIKITTLADAPVGSGLGTSSTLVVAMVQAMQGFLHLPLGEYEVAHLAYEIERFDCGLSGGKQDQYAATFGGFNFMEFYDNRVIVNPLRIHNAVICELEASLVLYFTGVSRESAHIIDIQSNNIQREDPVSIAATHSVKHQAILMKEGLLRGDFEAVCKSLRQAWSAKCKMAAQITNEHIDMIYDKAMASGARAGKISGAGGGGFIMFIVDPVRRMDVINTLSKFGGQILPCNFSQRGAEYWHVV